MSPIELSWTAKNHPVFDTDDQNVIDLPRQTLRFLSIDASPATILPPKINKVWLFVAQKVDKSFTPEQRKSENIFIKYLKSYLFIIFPTILGTNPQPIFNLQLTVPNAHLRAGNDILMEVLNKDSWQSSFIRLFFFFQTFWWPIPCQITRMVIFRGFLYLLFGFVSSWGWKDISFGVIVSSKNESDKIVNIYCTGCTSLTFFSKWLCTQFNINIENNFIPATSPLCGQ